MISPVLVLIIVLLALLLEIAPKFLIALLGVMFLIITGAIPLEEAFSYVDVNVIGALMSLMIIVEYLKKTKIFHYIGLKIVNASRGRPILFLISMLFFSYITSIILTNVTSMVVIIAVTLTVCGILGIDPIPLLLCQSMVAIMSGIALPTSSPLSLIIANTLKVRFTEFAAICFPASFLTLIILSTFYYAKFGEKVAPKVKTTEIDASKVIDDPKAFKKGIFVLCLLVIAVLFSDKIGYPLGFSLFSIALLCMVFDMERAESLLYNVDWPLLILIASLQMLVGAVEHQGYLKELAYALIPPGEEKNAAAVRLFLSSVVLSAFTDNIPVAMIMSSIVKEVGYHPKLLAAIVFGTAFGGFLLPISSVQGLLLLSMCRREGKEISTMDYLGISLPTLALSITAGLSYLLII